MAKEKYNTGDMSRARKLLGLCADDLRGWEWHRLTHILDQSVMTLRGHYRYVTTVTFSPDGERIVSGGYDGKIRLWDATTGGELMTLLGHTGPIRSAALSPDGERIVSAGRNKTIRVWDAATGSQVKAWSGHEGGIGAVLFSPDGKRIVDRKSVV
jgi:WD40 repeat protein